MNGYFASKGYAFAIRGAATRSIAVGAVWAAVARFRAARAWARALALLCLAWAPGWPGAAFAAPTPIPAYSAPVVDEAGMLKPETVDRLNQSLMGFQKERGAQIAVLTVESLGGESIFDYGMRVVESWKPGRKGVDDGVLLLIARDERQARIMVGYGLEGTVTDFDAKSVIDVDVVPKMKAGDPDGAVSAAANALMELIGAGALPERYAQSAAASDGVGVQDWAEGAVALFLVLQAIFGSVEEAARKGAARVLAAPVSALGFAATALWAIPAIAPEGERTALILAALLYWLAMWFFAGRLAQGGQNRGGRGGGRSGGGWSSGGGRGGFGGGGGGGFGGGGASGRW